MKVSRQAEPLRPDELRALRVFLRTETVEEYLEPAEVARRLKLNKRTVLDMVHDGVFPGAVKPFPNKIRIPTSSVVSFLKKHRVRSEAETSGVQASVPDSEVSNG